MLVLWPFGFIFSLRVCSFHNLVAAVGRMYDGSFLVEFPSAPDGPFRLTLGPDPFFLWLRGGWVLATFVRARDFFFLAADLDVTGCWLGPLAVKTSKRLLPQCMRGHLRLLDLVNPRHF